jgi:hypothetical protein
MRVNGILLIAVLLFAQTAFSQDPSHASDPCQGPDVNVDLDMPPIDDQDPTPWCATFTAKALLDYNIHQSCKDQGCTYDSSHRVSAEDLNSMRADASDPQRGKYFELSRGEDIGQLLQGTQEGVTQGGKAVGPAMDKDLTLDRSLFHGSQSDDEIIKRLTDYYVAEAKQKGLAAACNLDPSSFTDLTQQMPDIQKVADQVLDTKGVGEVGLTRFLDAVAPKAGIPDAASAGRKSFPAPFNVVEFHTANPQELMSHIADALRNQHQPVAADVCMVGLANAEGFSGDLAGLSKSDSCGAHAMTVIGFKKIGNKCEVHLRNSWGDHWPEKDKKAGREKDGDGNIWVSAANFLNNQELGSEKPPAMTAYHIEPRQANSPIANTEHGSDGSSSVGIFKDGRLFQGAGTGLTLENGGRFTGEVKDGFMAKGIVTDYQWNQKSRYTGSVDGGLPMKGTMTFVSNGGDIGSYTGTFNKSSGYQDGTGTRIQGFKYKNEDMEFTGSIVNGRTSCGLAVGTEHRWCFSSAGVKEEPATLTTAEACGCPAPAGSVH